jgi:hypothetical protein
VDSFCVFEKLEISSSQSVGNAHPTELFILISNLTISLIPLLGAAVLFGGSLRIKNRQDRGARRVGWVKSTLSNSQFHTNYPLISHVKSRTRSSPTQRN